MLKNDYPRARRAASRAAILQAVHYDGQPQGDTDPQRGEHVIIDGLDATQFVADCNQALLTVRELDGEDWYNLLRWLYFEPLPSAVDVMARMGLEHSAFYERRQRASCAFAEVFSPAWGELLVYA